MKKIFSALVVAVGLAGAPAADAAVVVFQDTIVTGAGTSGLQDWQGRLGMDFTVVNPIVVSALGAFNNGEIARLDGVSGGGIDVGIFNLTSGLLVGTAVHFDAAGTYLQIQGDAFQSVPNFVLNPGNYSIVAVNDRNYNQGFLGGSTNQYQTLNSINGSIVFGGPSRYDSNSTLGIPIHIDGEPVNRYGAGTFMASAIPEASTWIMMLIGFLGIAHFYGRKGRQARKQEMPC